MSQSALLADELRRAFYGEAWHGDPLIDILRGVTAAQAAQHPIPNAHSIWGLVLHIAAWDGAVRRRMTGLAVQLSGEENFPPVSTVHEAAWQQALEHLETTHNELVDAVEKFPDASFAKPVPGKSGDHYTFAFMLHGISQHVAYHAGQIALLKKF